MRTAKERERERGCRLAENRFNRTALVEFVKMVEFVECAFATCHRTLPALAGDLALTDRSVIFIVYEVLNHDSMLPCPSPENE